VSNPNDPEQNSPNDSSDREATGDPGPPDTTTSEGGAAGESLSAGQQADDPPVDDPHATVLMSTREMPKLDGNWPADPDDPLVGSLLRNKWRVLGRIGSGSFGTVYKVEDVNGEWIEALKILSVDRLRGPDAENVRKRFLREAQIMKRLGSLSPHIVGLSTYEDDIEAGLIYFLMEHVEGRILSEVLLQDGPLGVERTIRIGLQVCDALIAAHESEEAVVHRDLKLENLMLTTDREGRESIKVLDFGIAKIAEQEQDSRLTGGGTLGTPGYAAPEQLRAGPVDGRTDLFAFGVILYSLVTGRNPWLGHLAYQPTNQTYELMAASDRAEVIPISQTGVEVPPRMVAIIMKLLQREPAARFQSARELRDALLTLGGGQLTTGGLHLTRESSSSGGSSSEPGRRLAAVWFADLVGYSTLSSQDEEAALALLDTFHKTARRVIEGGGGRIVQFIGDAAFAEFSSTQRAVGTAKDFLEAFAEDTAGYPFVTQLRIGVHVGDVLMAPDGDLFGDGVNIAARIQNEAEPGQILVSQDVWRQLRQRRDFGFIPIGERTLKGIGSPVSLFAVAEAGAVDTTGELGGGLRADTTTGLPTYPGTTSTRSGGKRSLKVAAAILLLAAVGGGGYFAINLGAGDGDPTARGSPSTDGSPVVSRADDSAEPTPGTEVVADVDPGRSGGAAPSGADPGATGSMSTDPDPTAADPTSADPRPTDGPAVGGRAGDASASDPPPTPPVSAVDPYRSRYEQLAETVSIVRRDAREGAHAGALGKLDDAEARWILATTAAREARYQGGFEHLQAAFGLFGEVVGDSDYLNRVDVARAAIDAALPGAQDSLVLEAAGFEAEADQAIADGRYPEGLHLLAQAAAALAETTRAPDEAAPATIVPHDVAAGVLGRLEAAIEAKDLERVGQVWTSMSDEQAEGFTQSFRSFRQFEVDFAVQGAAQNGDRIVVSVTTTYHINGDDSSLAQTFEMAERGGRWVIVEDRVAPGR
jgi:serine/threonine protein kinase